jgi:hypothetical protein
VEDGGPDYEGMRQDASIIFSALATDVDFSKTFGIKILEGKDFSGAPVDSSTMMFNKAAIAAMGIKNPVGMKIRYGGKDYTVIGITDDVTIESPFKPVDPLMMFYNKDFSSRVSIRLKDGADLKKSIAPIEKFLTGTIPLFHSITNLLTRNFQRSSSTNI